MKIDYCDRCGLPVFFEHTQCLSCGSELAFFPDRSEICSLEKATDQTWRRTGSSVSDGPTFRLCENYRVHSVCNWVVPSSDPNPFCLSCRLTRIIPDLGKPGAKDAWHRLEIAKRRLVYNLLALRLPLQPKIENDERGLAFEFRADPDPADKTATPVLTGHDRGVIVINIAEAHDVEREKRRLALGEPYRTLLGHFRHEIGHYYWDRLIAGGPLLAPFRERFGDETANYGEALKKYYDHGPAADWNQHFISAYATSHPWEDWAETWAHYLHMFDTLETSHAFGLSLGSARGRGEPRPVAVPTVERSLETFQAMLDDWFPLTCVLNNLNRSLGLADGYPFVLTDPVIEKLRFIHNAIGQSVEPTRDSAG